MYDKVLRLFVNFENKPLRPENLIRTQSFSLLHLNKSMIIFYYSVM